MKGLVLLLVFAGHLCAVWSARMTYNTTDVASVFTVDGENETATSDAAQTPAQFQKLTARALKLKAAADKFMDSLPDGCYPNRGKWAAVCEKLGKLNYPFSLTVGTSKRREFTFFSEGRAPIIPDDARSISKWYTVTVIGGVVAKRYMSFDDKVSKWFKWWTTDKNDRRSRVTLRHLLTFTTGFQGGPEVEPPCINLGSGMGPINAADPKVLFQRMGYGIEDCAKQIYDRQPHTAEPGSRFDYTNAHLQIALAMAVKATHMPARLLYQRYLFIPAGMRFTMYEAGGGLWNPLAGGGALTPVIDLDAFGRAYLRKTRLPAGPVMQEMDTNWVAKFGSSNSWGGSFGMGHQPLTSYSGHCNGHDFQFWGGGAAGKIIIDRTANLYIAFMTGYAWDSTTESGDDAPGYVFPEILAALDKRC